MQSVINVYMFDQVLHKVNYPNIIMKTVQNDKNNSKTIGFATID